MGQRIPNEELLTGLQNLADKNGAVPTSTEMDKQGPYSAATYIKRFDSWTGALFRAGLRKSKDADRQKISSSDLIEGLKSFAEKLEKTPTHKEMNERGPYSSGTYTRRFGSWGDALKKAGMKPHRESVQDKSDDELLDAIRDVADKIGKRPTIEEMEEHGEYSPWVYLSRFETWIKACEKAGLEYTHAQRIPDAELIEALQELSEQLGRTPTADDMDNQGPYSSSVYLHHFETWNNAVEKSGLEINSVPSLSNLDRWSGYFLSEEELIDGLEQFAEDLGTPPTAKEMDESGPFSHSVYRQRFGTWNSALKLAGLEINFERIDVSKSELIGEIQRIASELGRPPTSDEMNKFGEYGPWVFDVRFGSWNQALTEAGFDVHRQQYPNVSNADLLEELALLEEKVDKQPTMTDMEKHGSFSPWTYLSRFGSWMRACEAAGIDYDQNRISDDDLIIALQRLGERIGKSPTIEHMNELGEYSATTYHQRFGSWNSALAQAGYDRNKPVKVNKEQLLSDLKRFADQLGRLPTQSDMKELGPYSSSTYDNHFGSWNVALEEAGLESRPQPLRGEDSPNWKGGAKSYYGSNWSEQRSSALERDQYQCQDCRINQSEHIERFGAELHVHHLIPLREHDVLEEGNKTDNLVTLCAECHRKWEGIPLRPDCRES